MFFIKVSYVCCICYDCMSFHLHAVYVIIQHTNGSSKHACMSKN